ncbi:MAG: FAD-dependent oxidoreductase, partial [Candidatus Brocadiia bacterium]
MDRYKKASVLIIGAGPAGLAAAIQLKAQKPDIEVCVIDKAADLGNHNLSGAVLEPQILNKLLDSVAPGWDQTDEAKQLLSHRIEKDDVMFLLGKSFALNILFAIKLAKIFKMGFG